MCESRADAVGSDGAASGEQAPRRPALAADMLLAAVVLVVALPIVEPLMAQQASRYALTAALVDHGTVTIDRYEDSLSVDYAEREGRLYSDKAPGQPFLATPAYAAYRLAGGEPAESHRPLGNTGLWAVSAWSAALPAAGLVVLMRRAAMRVAPGRATAAALATALSTMLLPFSIVLFSHVLTALLLFGGYLMLRPADPRRALAFVGAGFLVGLAVAVEYSAALVAPVLLAVAVLRGRRRAGWFAAGGMLPAVGLAAYHWVAFGAPLAFSYQYSHFVQHAGARPRPGWPGLPMLAEVLAGERGLLVLTPLVAVGLIGLVLLACGADRRLDGVVGLAVVGVLLLLMAGWSNPTGGASPGPRYLVPALPFLVFGVAEAWRRWPALVWAAAGVGVVTMGLATFTLPLAPRDAVAVVWWAERLVSGQSADVIVPGGGWVLSGAALAGLLLAIIALRTDARPTSTGEGEVRSRP